MKPTAICLVGKSGSGKTTASFHLQKEYSWEAIVSYTTRPIRKEEVNGVDHHFVSKDKVPPREMMAAYTEFAGYEYWTTQEQFLSLFPVVYVIDEKGLLDFEERGICDIISIYISRANFNGIEKSRQERDQERTELPLSHYDYIISNNGELDGFLANLNKIANDITKRLNL